MRSFDYSDLPPGLLDQFSVARKAVLAAEILSAYLLVRWRMLRSGPIAEVLEGLRRAKTSDGSPDSAAETYVRAARMAWAVRRTLRMVPTDSRCLMQSLVLIRLLVIRNVPTTLIIGVQAEPDFKAHAWVEYMNAPLLPASQGVYERLVRL